MTSRPALALGWTKGFPKGFTLIELMISITIVSMIITFGVSAYSKARDRQAGQNAAGTLVEILRSNQTKARIGDKDCAGKYQGQKVIISTPNTVTWQSQCEGGVVGDLFSTTLDNVTFTGGTTLTFNPLSRGINLTGNALSENIRFTGSSSLSYLVTLTNTGTIEYMGIQ